MFAPTTTVEYALVHADSGAPAVSYRQDDDTEELVTDSLDYLISRIADWDDTTSVAVLRDIKGDVYTNRDDDGDATDYRIVRREVRTTALSADDVAKLTAIRTAALRCT